MHCNKLMWIFAIVLIVAMVGCKGADLAPASPDPDSLPGSPGSPDLKGFCNRDSEGKLVIFVTNEGYYAALASTTRVEFKWGGGTGSQIVDLTTPIMDVGEVVELAPHIEIPQECFDPDCSFTITVDYNDEVIELDETNNIKDGSCIG